MDANQDIENVDIGTGAASPNEMPTLPDADAKIPSVAMPQPADPGTDPVWKSAGSAGSNNSACGEVIDMNKFKNLWKAVEIAASTVAVNVLVGFVVGLWLSYVLNDMITGDPNTVSATSQLWYTLCLTTRSAILVLASEFVNIAGSWWGRKRMLGYSQLFNTMYCLMSIVAVAADAVPLHAVANIFAGLCSGDKASSLAYISDVSTLPTHTKNMAHFLIWGGAGIATAMVVYIALPPMGGYAVAGTFVVGSYIIREIWLPDWSPPKEKRTTPTWKQMLETVLPCHVYFVYKPQTPFVKCLLWTQFFQYCALGSQHAYFANYVLIRYDMQQFAAGAWILIASLVAVMTTTVALKILPLSSVNYLMWTTPLFSLYITVMGAKHTMWSGMVLYFPRLIPLAQLDIIYYGQLSARRRHELASVENMMERLGYLGGAISIAIYSPVWVDNYQNGDQSIPAVPIVSVVFEFLVMGMFYLGTYRYRHQDLYGQFFMVVKDGAETEKDAAAFQITFAAGVKVVVKDEGGIVGTSEGKNADDDKNAIAGCYRVRLEDGKVIESKPENLELHVPEGA